MLYRIDINTLAIEYFKVDLDGVSEERLDKMIAEWLEWVQKDNDLNTIRDDELLDMVKIVLGWEEDWSLANCRLRSLKPVEIVRCYAWWFCYTSYFAQR